MIKRELLLLLVYPFFVIVVSLALLLPRCVRIKFGIMMSNLLWRLDRKSHKIAYNNLRIAYPDKSDEEVVQMAQKVMKNIIRTMIDFFSSSILVSKKRFFSMVEVEGEEHLRAAYERGKGVICMVPHLSAWELSAVTPPMLGYTTYAASKPIKGKLFNATFVWLRARRGMINIARDGSYKKLIEVLNGGNCLIIMADQDTKVKGEFVPFYGKPAYTPIGISRMALDTEAAVVPMAMTRKDNGLYKFTIYPELKTIRTDNYDSDCVENTHIQSEEYERIIRQTPTQWVWMHRRWKTTPESLAQFLANKKKKQNKA